MNDKFKKWKLAKPCLDCEEEQREHSELELTQHLNEFLDASRKYSPDKGDITRAETVLLQIEEFLKSMLIELKRLKESHERRLVEFEADYKLLIGKEKLAFQAEKKQIAKNEIKKQFANRVLGDLEELIKSGQIKIDWIESSEEYNEEEQIKGLYTDDFYLSLWWSDKTDDKFGERLLYRLFPSNKERKEKKPNSWRKADWWLKSLTKQDKEFVDKELELIKDCKSNPFIHCGKCCPSEKGKNHGK